MTFRVHKYVSTFVPLVLALMSLQECKCLLSFLYLLILLLDDCLEEESGVLSVVDTR